MKCFYSWSVDPFQEVFLYVKLAHWRILREFIVKYNSITFYYFAVSHHTLSDVRRKQTSYSTASQSQEWEHASAKSYVQSLTQLPSVRSFRVSSWLTCWQNWVLHDCVLRSPLSCCSCAWQSLGPLRLLAVPFSHRWKSGCFWDIFKESYYIQK